MRLLGYWFHNACATRVFLRVTHYQQLSMGLYYFWLTKVHLWTSTTEKFFYSLILWKCSHQLLRICLECGDYCVVYFYFDDHGYHFVENVYKDDDNKIQYFTIQNNSFFCIRISSDASRPAHLLQWRLIGDRRFPASLYPVGLFPYKFTPPIFYPLGMFLAGFFPAKPFPLLFHLYQVFHRCFSNKEVNWWQFPEG